MAVHPDSYSAYNARDPEGPGPVGYLALVLAWAVPGLGHFLLGQKGRGIVFALAIHLLFAAGLLVGGIRAINPQDQAIWTYTQFLTGWPMVLANRLESQARGEWQDEPATAVMPARPARLRQAYEDQAPPSGTPERQAYARKFFAENPLFVYHPKVQDMGSVYCGIAGMLNLLVMFDVLLRITGSVRDDPASRKKRQHTAPSPPAPSEGPAPAGGAA